MSKKWPDESKCMRSDWNAWYEFVKHHLLVNGERAHKFRPRQQLEIQHPPNHHGPMREIMMLPKQYHQFLTNVVIPTDDGWAVAESLMKGDLLMGGDGPVKNRPGTHGYKLQPNQGDSIHNHMGHLNKAWHHYGRDRYLANPLLLMLVLQYHRRSGNKDSHRQQRGG